MEEIKSGVFAALDMIKCLIIVYGVFGFKIRKKKKVLWCVPVAVLGVIGHIYAKDDAVFVDMLTQCLIVLFLFKTSIRTKIKISMLQFILMSSLDMLIWLIIVGITPLRKDYKTNELIVEVISNVIVIIIWILISAALKNKSNNIKNKLEKIKVKEFLFFTTGLFSVILVVSGIQGQFWHEMTPQIQRAIMVLGVFVVVFLFVVLILFAYVSDSKEKLQYINQLNEQCIKYQKDYYMEIIKFDEEMRAFRHDVNKHYEVLLMLIYEKDWNRAKKYISQLSNKKDVGRVFKTGNTIADYIINGKTKEIKNQGNVELNVIGTFPQNMQIEDTDLCIVLGNALDNAGEALEKVKGVKQLNIDIGSYKQSLFLEITNSAMEIETKNFKTTKKDKINHGYGLENIKYVVFKYNGKVTTEYENGCFSLKIEL